MIRTALIINHPPGLILSAISSVISSTPPLNMPSLFPTLVNYALPSGSPYTGPELSMLPNQLTPKDPPDKTIPDPSSPLLLLLFATTNVMPKNAPSGTFIVTTSVTYETTSGSPYPGLTPSNIPSKVSSKNPPDKTYPDLLSPSSMILTITTATYIKKPTANPSIPQIKL